MKAIAALAFRMAFQVTKSGINADPTLAVAHQTSDHGYQIMHFCQTMHNTLHRVLLLVIVCHPSDCAWGQAEGTPYGPAVEANLAQTAQVISTIYITSFSQIILIILPADNGQIQVEVLTKFTDQSGRANITGVYTLSRVKGAGADK